MPWIGDLRTKDVELDGWIGYRERVSDDGTYLIPHVLASVMRILLFPTPSRTCDNIGELLRVTNDCLSGNPCWACSATAI